MFPPTVVDVGHLTSPVREDGTHEYVLIDSTQSWANRLEEVADDPALGLPRIEVQVGAQSLSACTLPHRVYDAILRDSTDGTTTFRDTELGRSLVSARPSDATALLRHAPTVLLFGGWDSFAGLKVGAAKWPAALSGQILGFDAQLSRKTGVRVDPLEISIDDFQSYKAAAPAEVWTLDADAAEKDGKGKPVTLKPSEVGHGNIPAAVAFKEAWVSRIELRSALSITRLRRYHYPVNGVASPERDRDGGGAGRPGEPLGEQRHPITGIRKHPCGPSADVQSLPGRRHRQRARAWQARPAGRCRRQPSRQRCAEQAAWLRAAPSRRIPRRCCHP